jgi:hypothetical protein
MFGYKSGQLDGRNVAMLMPAPFSQRHNLVRANHLVVSAPGLVDRMATIPTALPALPGCYVICPQYLSAYASTGKGNILDTVRQVVALHRCEWLG